MAARLCGCGCGREIPAAARSHKLTLEGSCRQRVHRRAAASSSARSILEHEPLVVAQAREGHLSPEDAILWVCFPDQMRARGTYVIEGEQVAA